jgi:hypothetical protein
MNLSWNVFFIFTAIGLVVYYGAVIFIFFRKKKSLAGGCSNGDTKTAAAKQQRPAGKQHQTDVQIQAAPVYIDTKIIREEDYAAAPEFAMEMQHEYQAVNDEHNDQHFENTVNYETEAGIAAQLAHEAPVDAHNTTNAQSQLYETGTMNTVAVNSDAAYELAVKALSLPDDMLVQLSQTETTVQQAGDNSNRTTGAAQDTEIPVAMMQEDMRRDHKEPQKIGSLMHLVNKKSFQ